MDNLKNIPISFSTVNRSNVFSLFLFDNGKFNDKEFKDINVNYQIHQRRTTKMLPFLIICQRIILTLSLLLFYFRIFLLIMILNFTFPLFKSRMNILGHCFTFFVFYFIAFLCEQTV